jgi:hypothetical protein
MNQIEENCPNLTKANNIACDIADARYNLDVDAYG